MGAVLYLLLPITPVPPLGSSAEPHLPSPAVPGNVPIICSPSELPPQQLGSPPWPARGGQRCLSHAWPLGVMQSQCSGASSHLRVHRQQGYLCAFLRKALPADPHRSAPFPWWPFQGPLAAADLWMGGGCSPAPSFWGDAR